MTYCNDTECQYYNPNGCTATEIRHSTDRFCITGCRRPRDDIKQLMKESEPTGVKRGGKYKSNRVGLLK